MHTSHRGEEFHVNSDCTRLQLNMTGEMSQMECGHLGNFLLTLSRSVFEELITIAKKLESEVQTVNKSNLQLVCLRKFEWFSRALVNKRQFGVVAHMRLCASALLRHGRTSRSTPIDPSRNEYSPQSDYTRSRIRLVEPKSLMPDRFGKKNGPSWRTWSYFARDFVGVVHETGDEECRKQETADRRDKSPT